MSTSEVMARILEGRPLGGTLWMRIHGRSMQPLLWSGQALHLVRCNPEDVRPGDVAVGLRPEGFLVAHVVSSTTPPTLSTLLGRPDPEGTRILARAFEVKLRSGRVVPIPAQARWPVFGVHRTLAALVQSRTTRRLIRRGAEAAWLARTEVLTRIRGEPEARPLTGDELEDAVSLIADTRDVPYDRIKYAVEQGRAVGLFHAEELRAVALLEAGAEPLILSPTFGAGAIYGPRLRALLTRSRSTEA